MVLNLKQSSKDLSRINEGEKTGKYTTKIVIDNSQPCVAFMFFYQGFIAQATL